jgi:hypothetical protein
MQRQSRVLEIYGQVEGAAEKLSDAGSTVLLVWAVHTFGMGSHDWRHQALTGV